MQSSNDKDILKRINSLTSTWKDDISASEMNELNEFLNISDMIDIVAMGGERKNKVMEIIKQWRDLRRQSATEREDAVLWRKNLPEKAIRVMDMMLRMRVYLFENADGTLRWRGLDNVPAIRTEDIVTGEDASEKLTHKTTAKRNAAMELKEFLLFVDKDILEEKCLKRQRWAEIFNVEKKFFQVKINKMNPSIISLNRILAEIQKHLTPQD